MEALVASCRGPAYFQAKTSITRRLAGPLRSPTYKGNAIEDILSVPASARTRASINRVQGPKWDTDTHAMPYFVPIPLPLDSPQRAAATLPALTPRGAWPANPGPLLLRPGPRLLAPTRRCSLALGSWHRPSPLACGRRGRRAGS